MSCGRGLVIEIIQINVVYETAMTAPTSDTPAIEHIFGNWARMRQRTENTKHHSIIVIGLSTHLWHSVM